MTEQIEGGAGEPGVDPDEGLSRAEKKAQSRRRILDSAKEVFFRDGFMAANLDEVAEKAKVAKGTLYRYFESKADLYVAVLSESGGVFTEKMREAAKDGQDVHERLRAVSRFYLAHWTEHSEYFRIFWAIDNQEVIGELPASVVDEISRLWEQSLAVLQELLDAGVASGEFGECDTWEVANILWSLANALLHADTVPARRELRRRSLEDTFLDGISLILAGLQARTAS